MSEGSTTNAMVTFSLIVLVLLVFSLLFIQLRDWYSTSADGADCATQVLSHASTVKWSKEMIAPQITCPTVRKKVEVKDEELAKRYIAEEMATCWATWGKGKHQLFKDKELIFCHICSMMVIDGVDQVQGMPLYLARTKMPGSDQTYYQYLGSPGEISGDYYDSRDFEDSATSVFPTKDPVAIIFYYGKGEDILDMIKNRWLGNLGTGAATGLIIGAGLAYAVSAPVSLTVTMVFTGTLGGGISSFVIRDNLSYVSMVVARPLNEAQIRDLGCEYVPTKN